MSELPDKVEAALTDDFNRRLDRVKEQVERITSGRGGEQMQALYEQGVKLYEIDSTDFYSTFKALGCSSLKNLEGWESYTSFIANTFDDSYVGLVVDEELTKIHRDVRAQQADILDREVPEVEPSYMLAWVSDVDDPLRPEQLIDYVDQKIQEAQENRRFFEALERGESLFDEEGNRRDFSVEVDAESMEQSLDDYRERSAEEEPTEPGVSARDKGPRS